MLFGNSPRRSRSAKSVRARRRPRVRLEALEQRLVLSTTPGDSTSNGDDELALAQAAAVYAPGAVAGTDDEARARLGDYFAEVLLLDQGTVATKARAKLGWSPSRPSLIDEFRHGSYHAPVE